MRQLENKTENQYGSLPLEDSYLRDNGNGIKVPIY